jgi:hypothetical protein
LEVGRSHRVPNQGNMVSGVWQPFCFSPATTWWGWSAVMVLGTNLAATRCMPNSFIRTHWHVP